jgi:predicted hydrolase (HD superfamily)
MNMTKEHLPIDREKAVKILEEMPQTDFDMSHYIMSEAIMRAVARRLKKDEDYWGMIGLLHDIDWSHTKNDTENHGTKCEELVI